MVTKKKGRSYLARLFDFTQMVAAVSLPQREKFCRLIATNFGPERVYHNVVQTESGKKFIIIFSYDEFEKGTLEGMKDRMPGKINKQTKKTLQDLIRKGISIDDAAAFLGIDPRSVLAIIKGAAAEMRRQSAAEKAEEGTESNV